SANAAHDHASIAHAAGWPETFLASAPKVAERFDQLVRLGNLTRKEINGATYMYGDLAENYIYIHRFDEAVRYARKGTEISRTTSTIPGPRAQCFCHLASALMYSGDVPGALDAMHESLGQLEELRRQQEAGSSYFREIYALVHKREGLILGEDGSVNLN